MLAIPTRGILACRTDTDTGYPGVSHRPLGHLEHLRADRLVVRRG